MKPIFLFLTLSVCLFISCQKGDDLSPYLLTANAGNDTTFMFQSPQLTLNGSASVSEGNISSYLWTKISGPSVVKITSPSEPTTTVTNIAEGTYAFELAVTGTKGAVVKDTITITLASYVTARLIMEQSLFGAINMPNAGFSYLRDGNLEKITSNFYPERRIAYNKNGVSSIEYWSRSSNGTLSKAYSHDFQYDNNGNVIKINKTDKNGTKLSVAYTYNTDKTLSSKKMYDESGLLQTDNAYIYENGNIVGIVYNSAGAADTIPVSYDTRTNTFPFLLPQLYFLDVQTVFDQTNRSEIFFFSQNYPVTFGTTHVDVTLGTNYRPSEIKFDDIVWFAYSYD